MKLSQNYIDYAEKAVKSSLLTTDDIFKKSILSIADYERLKEMWIMIRDDTINSYYQFAEYASGMKSYGLYKANNGEIYIIEAFLNEIEQIYTISKKFEFLKELSY